MATTMVFQLALLFDEPVNDAAGNWQYAGATAVETTTGRTAQLIATKRTNTVGTDSFPVSMLTATILFAPLAEGAVASNITIQGVHDLKTNDESGSVSAASAEFADQIGGTFTFTKGVLTIFPPGVSPRAAVQNASVLDVKDGARNASA